ncbi:MAG TPA: hypothetical protein VLC09_12145, partial [Polyangiaceae bacterium]|nr:hypothetical protein [Polyangiaceae bacterium]
MAETSVPTVPPSEQAEAALRARADRLELLHRISLALGAERDRDRLLEIILEEAQRLCRADGGTLYLRTPKGELGFAILRNASLGQHLGGTS